ncbi:hypothetical protein OSTOST_12457 [Ostertagia ostertagi]
MLSRLALVALSILVVNADASEIEKRNSASGVRCLTRDVLKEVILEVFVAKYGPYFEWYYKMADEAERMIDRGVESPYTGVFYTKSFDNKEQRKMEDKVRRTLEKYPLLKQPYTRVSFGCYCEHWLGRSDDFLKVLCLFPAWLEQLIQFPTDSIDFVGFSVISFSAVVF